MNKRQSSAEKRYAADVGATRARRMEWWHKARYGMFVHWGLYSIPARGEWIMNRERTPLQEYEALAQRFRPRANFAREWADLAVRSGMKYVVMTAKHHDGYCLWETKQSDYNSVRRGPGRDLVREYVDACREAGLRVGLYYSLMDWRHPDGERCLHNAAARRRFLDYTRGCVEELCSNYGTIDVLWYDMPLPLQTAREWESLRLNRQVRALQPKIIINDRSRLEEDFATSENKIRVPEPWRPWEACMVLNGVFGWQPTPPADWVSTRQIIEMMRQVASRRGNLLLNVAPRGDGSIPSVMRQRLLEAGSWLTRHQEAFFGPLDSADRMDGILPGGGWSVRGNTAFYWVQRWAGETLPIGGIRDKILRVTLLTTKRRIAFRQEADRLILCNLPRTCPDRKTQSVVFKIQFAKRPRQCCGPQMGSLYERAHSM